MKIYTSQTSYNISLNGMSMPKVSKELDLSIADFFFSRQSIKSRPINNIKSSIKLRDTSRPHPTDSNMHILTTTSQQSPLDGR
jgi:hypothetical protein